MLLAPCMIKRAEKNMTTNSSLVSLFLRLRTYLVYVYEYRIPGRRISIVHAYLVYFQVYFSVFTYDMYVQQ